MTTNREKYINKDYTSNEPYGIDEDHTQVSELSKEENKKIELTEKAYKELLDRIEKLEKCNRIAEVKEHIEEKIDKVNKELYLPIEEESRTCKDCLYGKKFSEDDKERHYETKKIELTEQAYKDILTRLNEVEESEYHNAIAIERLEKINEYESNIDEEN